MNSRERVRAAIHHQQPDRLPLDMGSTAVSGIAAGAYTRLRQALGLPDRLARVTEPFQVLGDVEDDVRDALGIDTVGLGLPSNFFGFKNEDWKPWTLFDGTNVLVPGKFTVRKDENGGLLIYAEGDTSAAPSGHMPKDGYYFDATIRQQALDWDHLDPKEWADQMYSVYTPDDVHYLKERAGWLYANTERSLVWSFGGGGFGDIAWVPGPNLPHPKGIRDPLDWIIAHKTNPEYIKGIFELQCERGIENARLVWEAAGSKIDVVFVSGTDFGTQDRLFISPAMYRELYKPFHKRINDWIKHNTTWKIFFHTCGSIVDLLDDLVDVGVDIVNPVQCSAKGMDAKELKAKYGRQLVFWGGGVDTQWTLPFGTPDDVYEQVQERIRVFSPGGGFVFNTIHNIQQNVPVENLLAMFRAVRDSGQ
jgi:hypothetical protein